MLRLRLLMNCVAAALVVAVACGPREALSEVAANAATTNSSTNVNASSNFTLQKQEEALRAAKSKEVLSYMNLSVSPCKDFYEFACGNWNKYHTPADKQEEETPDTLLENKINKDLHHLLDENATIDDSLMARKVKIFYKSCMEARRNEEHHQTFLKDFIKSNGGFPAVPGSSWLTQYQNYNWQQTVAGLRYHYGLDILVGIDIDLNYQNLHENSIYLMEPSTLIPRHLCGQEVTQRIEVTDQIYDAVEQEVAENLRLWLSLKTMDDALKLAADIVTFEYDICKGMYVNESLEEAAAIGASYPDNVHKKYTRTSLLEFNHMFNNTIDFNAIVRNSFGIPINNPVYMKSPAYFEQLVKVIDEYNDYNRMVVPNYIMYRAMTHINLPLKDTPHNRPAYCLQMIKKYFPKVLGDMYYRKYSNSADKEAAESIFAKLKDQFGEALRQDWIEETTKSLGENKLAQLNLHIPSYEKDSLNLDFERNDYWKNLKIIMGHVRAQDFNRIFATSFPAPKDEVEAYETRLVYRPHHKRIEMGWGILQQPFFHAQLPMGMRFAAIGQKLAQFLATVFDGNGWMSDTRGNSNWDPQTALQYYKRANCLRQQIGNYLYNRPQSYNQSSNTRRIIAKSVGLNMAFKAYIDWLQYQHPSNDQTTLFKETLTNLDFTNTQLFFITFAQMQCKGQQKPKKLEWPKPFSPLTNHSMIRFEVNGPLRNFEEFAREFHCPLGTEMSAADKCIIY